MMKTVIKCLLAGLLLLSGLSGCVRDELEVPSPPPSGELVRVKFALSEAQFRAPVSRASSTRTIRSGGLEITLGEMPESSPALSRWVSDDEEIRHLWILQFNHTGNDDTDKLVHMREMWLDDENSTRITSSQYSIEVDLRFLDNCLVVFLANCDGISYELEDLLSPGNTTVADFKALQSERVGDMLSNGYMPMTGQYIGDVPDENLHAVMVRMGARIDLDVRYETPLSGSGGELYLETAQLKSVPRIGQLAESESIPYPARYTGNFHNEFNPETIPAGGSSTTFNTTWYIPENRGGTGTNTGIQEYKWRETAPGYPQDYCTHIELKGSFYENPDTRALNPERRRNITITFYPGADILNDFSIRRNHHYRITANITQVEVARDDKRVEITDLIDGKAEIRFFYVDANARNTITTQEYFTRYVDVPSTVAHTDGPYGETSFPGYDYLYAEVYQGWSYVGIPPLTADTPNAVYDVKLYYERRIDVSFDYYLKDTTTPVEGTPTAYRSLLYGDYIDTNYLSDEGLLKPTIGGYSLHSIEPANYGTTPVTEAFNRMRFYYEPYAPGESSSVTVIRGYYRGLDFIPYTEQQLGEPAAKVFNGFQIGSTFEVHDNITDDFLYKPMVRNLGVNTFRYSEESIVVVKNPEMNIIYIGYEIILAR